MRSTHMYTIYSIYNTVYRLGNHSSASAVVIFVVDLRRMSVFLLPKTTLYHYYVDRKYASLIRRGMMSKCNVWLV